MYKERRFICECGAIFYAFKEKFAPMENFTYWHTEKGFISKCPECGKYATECANKIDDDKQDGKKMDSESAIEGSFFDIDSIKKKLEKGENLRLEDIPAITNTNGLDQWNNMWVLIALLLAFGGWGGNSSADYWRGKYEAYKELYEGGKDG